MRNSIINSVVNHLEMANRYKYWNMISPDFKFDVWFVVRLKMRLRTLLRAARERLAKRNCDKESKQYSLRNFIRTRITNSAVAKANPTMPLPVVFSDLDQMTQLGAQRTP